MVLAEQARPGPHAGWYQDLAHPTGHRYWTGKAWLAADKVPAWGATADAARTTTHRLPEVAEKQTPAESTAERRSVVHQATGIVMAQFGIESEDAFHKLAAAVIQNQRPLVEVAREIVESGGL